MRIIAGVHRSRRLLAPPGFHTRPIPDRVKESMFGMLGERVNGAAVVDLFAGSGAIGLEAISRGAASCMFVDNDKSACATAQENVKALGCESQCRVVMGDALGASIVARCPRPIDLVYMDPPYPLVIDPAGWERVKAQAAALIALLAVDGFLVLRTPRPFELEAVVEQPGAASEMVRTPEPRRLKLKRKLKERREQRRRVEEGAEGEWIMRIDQPGGKAENVADEAELEEGAAEEGAATPVGGGPAVVKSVPDMSIPGARGPETHAYGTTAVHWYMKREE